MPSINRSKTKTPMPSQDAKLRSKNFNEVALGYTEEDAINEAQRCLNCKKPSCMEGCPVQVQIPRFIKHIAEKNFESAISVIKETNSLPAVCGRVCPQEEQCEQKCVLAKRGDPVGIGRLERFAADWERQQGVKIPDRANPIGKKVAIIGSGPAGLTCAGDLAKLGYDVTVFEAFHEPGGVLIYGIPEFRLPKEIVKQEVDFLKKLGVNVQTDMVMGKVLTVDDIFEKGYEAVFIGTGAGLPKFMKIPGENYLGVYSANEFLTRINLMKAYKFPETDTPVKVGKKVAVVGGGNVAMDSARSALRMGAEEVYIVYRRSESEMPARKEEFEHAKEEGIIFKFLTNPTRIIGDEKGWVKGLECIQMELGEPDASGRRRPVPIKGSEFTLDMDTVVIAIGTGPNPLLIEATEGLKLNKYGYIETDEDGRTSKEGVWAGGDIVTGSATVILAMGAGKKAAQSIHEYLQGK
ncbi:Sulfide dehydrogenase subunit alpha [Tepidanaerobacter acetatoxydans Re1]|uniref:Sulfide dehydrogenase subunit alpha n=1 Tax=Tepidanaerobacter acetatoxydans (strain DSM 21804 / JCM 16047 / Re1) TaxID=1209989 RepID=F4LU48_TEPAE|nr:NADPH-dependent glutamate synthase [Tepidanaerobacter acetatoxydans]AEE90574.1 glutamate synthase (NADPH), homotetrameric [Tepidanaerobacter acetatoxydans Re1]CCP25089.1 Sulfide dehydrogenase subunit alpha [Tepidanaerobacter acetatoxydans Re1]